MATPHSIASLDRRRSIVHRSIDLFLAQGFSGTSMAQIAAVVGGSKSTLYTYFPTKEALFEAVVDAVLLSDQYPLDEIDYKNMRADQGLKAIASAIFSAAQDTKSVEIHRLVFFEAQRNASIGRAFIKRGPELGRRHVQNVLEFFISSGDLHCSDPAKASVYFVSLLLYQHMLYREGGIIKPMNSRQIARHVDIVVDDFLKLASVL
jgi:TetR/AcrR family transcriptional repressor of mexJK operon